MKLSLSTRVVEAPRQKEKTVMGLNDLVALADDAGYSAVCMRASQVGIQHNANEIAAAKQSVAVHGMAISMVTGDIDTPANNDRAQMALQNITPFLDLAANLGSDLIRIGMKADTDIPWARRAADEAAERGIRLAHQSHTCTLFETIEKSVDVLKEIDRDNFGIIFEPGNLLVCGQDYGASALNSFKPWLMNVYLQNMRPWENGEQTIETWINGPVRFDLVPFGDSDGIDFAPIMDALDDVGYAGYVTVHHNVADGMEIGDGVRNFASYLRSVGDFE